MKIGFVGMTHLGLNSAVAATEKGFSVVAFDQNHSRIAALQQKKLTIQEPQLSELLQKNWDRLTFTVEVTALTECHIIYVAPDVPTDDYGNSDLSELRALIDRILPVLTNQILVIHSQVPPGFTRTVHYPHVFYQVETLIFGRAIERALFPERFIIGTSCSLPEVYLNYLNAYNCPIFPMKFESAELAKIAINLFLVSSVSTTNMVAELCEKIGAKWSEIVPTLRLDKRIGPDAYLAPGLGLAGGNLERDLKTFTQLADESGCDASLIRTWQQLSQRKRNWVLAQIHQRVLPKMSHPRFGILGLAYKKETASIKNSPALELIASLGGFSIRAYDPAVTALPDCYPSFELVSSAEQVCSEVDVIVIMTPWDQFKKVTFKNKTVIDPYGIIDQMEGCNYYTLGVLCET